jgi:hypothetical protein
MIKNCKECNTEFKTYPSKIKDNRGKYCSRNCADEAKKGISFSPTTQFKKGQKAHNFKGWRLTQSRPNGKKYKLIYKPEHPNADSRGYVREHRLVMEEVLGRLLEDYEVVDHINGEETLNNDPSNLRVMTKVEHDRMNVKLNIHRRWYD